MNGHANPAAILRCVLLAVLVAVWPAVAQEEKAERARLALAEERFDEAISIYEDLVKASPESVGLRMNLGIAQHARSQYAKAAGQFRFVVEKQPDFAAAWRMLGDCQSKLGETEKAVAAFARAFELEPRSQEVHLDYAAALLAAKKNERASDEFWKIAQTSQSDPRVWHGLAVSNAALARAEKDETKRKQFRERAERALEQLKETAGPAEDELLREAAKALIEERP